MDDLETIFWSKVSKGTPNECWEFKHVNIEGYGAFKFQDNVIKAHRLSWELSRKCKVPDGKYILHICNNRSCVNPHHLYCGTAADNAKDRSKSKHEIIRCTKISLAKANFYAGEIWLMRRLKGKHPSRYIAKMFLCDKGTILNIWKSSKYPCREGYYV